MNLRIVSRAHVRTAARRWLPAAACTVLCLPACPALSQQTARPDPARIRRDLDDILARPEFQPASRSNYLDGFVKWLGDLWDRFWNFFGRFFPHPSGVSVGSAGLQWIFIAIFLVIGAWLLSRLIRQYLNQRENRENVPSSHYTHEEFEEERVTAPEAWMQQAQQYARENDFRRAFRAVFLATILQMDRAGAIQYDRARTNGDYARTLRGKGLSALYEALLPLSRDFDARWYGNAVTSEADYRRCLTEYERVLTLLPANAAKPGAGR